MFSYGFFAQDYFSPYYFAGKLVQAAVPREVLISNVVPEVAGLTGCRAVVFREPTGDNLTGARLFEASPVAFDADLLGGGSWMVVSVPNDVQLEEDSCRVLVYHPATLRTTGILPATVRDA